MRLLFGYVNQDSSELEHPGSNVFVRGLDTSAFHAATCATLRRLDPDVVVLRTAPDEIGAVQRWTLGMVERNSLKHGVHLICVAQGAQGKLDVPARGRAGDACQVHVVEPELGQSGERLALRRAEEIATARARVWLSCLPRQTNRRVVLIGAGVVNLVIALHLVQAGYAVSILEGGPPPGSRTTRPRCTWSGGDGRIFSWNEARHHIRGRTPVAAARPFRRAISDGGWLCAPSEMLTEADQRWIDRYEQTPAWLRDVYHDSIIGANRDSDAGWWRLVEACPDIFANVGFEPRLYRVYPDAARLASGEREERGIGAFMRRLDSLEQVAREIPCLGEAIARGNVGGALQVRGFGLNIHKFGRALLEHLQAQGVEVRWNTYAHRVALDGVGNV
ncbi:MAG TPA: FAD-dependent oxidoreductase, partial [Polyangiaceae bacterium]|nr:FAD-dependent oxidoreductase [Polyangiaceae bacterium]